MCTHVLVQNLLQLHNSPSWANIHVRKHWSHAFPTRERASKSLAVWQGSALACMPKPKTI